MRWATPGGVTVETITLTDTPKPSRPGDPAQHYGPRDYLKVRMAHGRSTWHCAGLDELKEHAEREAWDLGQLAQLPEYVVADTLPGHGGHVISAGSDGEPFDKNTAAEFAAKRNAGLAEGKQNAHRVYALVDVTDQVLGDN